MIQIMSYGLIAQLSIWVLLPHQRVLYSFVNFYLFFSNGGFIADQDKGGHLAKWVEKVSFDRICWLLNIKPTQRTSQVLLTALNLLDIQRHPK